MLVKVLNFGTNWWARSGSEPQNTDRLDRHAVHYNSTGIRCGGKIRRHWITSGLLRLNGVLDFSFMQPERSAQQTFVCSDLTYQFGGNRLLLKSKCAKSAAPDSYLVVVSSEKHGWIDVGSKAWKSVFSRVIAMSQLRDVQEAMLLMQATDWIQTSSGFWQLQPQGNPAGEAMLVRLGQPSPRWNSPL